MHGDQSTLLTHAANGRGPAPAAMIGMLLLVAPLTASGMNVTNTVVFPGNKDAKGPACQSWW
jgi:hypothetical protein